MSGATSSLLLAWLTRGVRVMAVAVSVGLGPPATRAADAVQGGVPVRIRVLAEGQTPRSLPLAGRVVARDRAVLAARISGTVAEVEVGAGQAVKAGAVLVRLHAPELAARLVQAEAAADQARRDHSREASLLTKGAAVAEGVLALQDRVRITEAAVREAQALLSYTELRAPYDAVVTERHVQAGDLAGPGIPLVSLESPARLQVDVQVPESSPLLPLGTSVSIAGIEPTVGATVAELSPAAAAATRTRLARLDLPAGTALRSGQFVRVLWPAGEETTRRLPATALSTLGQVERLFVVEGGTARLRVVKTAPVSAAEIEVLSGVSVGEAVIIDPPAGLREGAAVEVRP